MKPLLISVYGFASIALFIYGLNAYLMIALYFKGRKKFKEQSLELVEFQEEDCPVVTTQVPLYNEANVAERVMRAVAAMDYPQDKHEIQIVDDSNDETREITNNVADELRAKGYRIEVIHRENRDGYKAGALKEAMAVCAGEFIAIFDGDFLPPKNFLKKSVALLLRKEKVCLVQGRWGHINQNASLFTEAQSIGIDGHFVIEQTARTYTGLFMNFNGTAGVWRKAAIIDAGNWQADTLTEDLDLSYRAQLKGWECLYLPDLIVPGEIPESVEAFKSQQFRWAKGSIQTAIKMFPRVLSSEVSLFKKVQAYFHLTHYLIHPLMLTLSLLALPMLHYSNYKIPTLLMVLLVGLLSLAVSAPNILYIVSQSAVYKDWYKRIFYLPMLMFIGVGIAASNTKAVFEAVVGIKSGFVRTPKKGDAVIRKYRIKTPTLCVVELFLGGYSFYSGYNYYLADKQMVVPFLMLYAVGFTFIGLSGLKLAIRRRGESPNLVVADPVL